MIVSLISTTSSEIIDGKGTGTGRTIGRMIGSVLGQSDLFPVIKNKQGNIFIHKGTLCEYI